MIKSFLALLFFCSLSYAAVPDVTYQEDTNLITIKGELTPNGYGYNLSANKVLRLVTLNWPPYIDESICNFGWVYQLTVAILVKNDYGVLIEFYPWARAVREAELGKADILFPEYFVADFELSDNVANTTRNQLLALSEAIPGGDLSLITLKDSNIQYNGSIQSVRDHVIGIIRSYKNTIELDQRIASNEIASIVVNNEFQLANLLINKRADLIVADLSSLLGNIKKSHLTEQQKQIINSSLVALEPSLDYKYLHYSVSRQKPNWQKVLNSINEEITKMSDSGMLEMFIEQKKSECNNKKPPYK